MGVFLFIFLVFISITSLSLIYSSVVLKKKEPGLVAQACIVRASRLGVEPPFNRSETGVSLLTSLNTCLMNKMSNEILVRCMSFIFLALKLADVPRNKQIFNLWQDIQDIWGRRPNGLFLFGNYFLFS